MQLSILTSTAAFLVAFSIRKVEGWTLPPQQESYPKDWPFSGTISFRHDRQKNIDESIIISKGTKLGRLFGLAILTSSCFGTTLSISSPAMASEGEPAYRWDLLNGVVQLGKVTTLKMSDQQTGAPAGDAAIQLANPQIIGAGSGGAVFAFEEGTSSSSSSSAKSSSSLPSSSSSFGAFSEKDLLLKISWETTAKTVQRECATLKMLEERKVDAAERCLGTFPYEFSSVEEPPRTMILVAPYMRDAVASLMEVDTETARLAAVDQIARTLVQMLAANVITIDVQPLISKSTGRTIFIDMTEAQELRSAFNKEHQDEDYGFLDKTLISSFVSEMVALIPEQYWSETKHSITEELNERRINGMQLSPRAMSVLEDQTPFF